MDREEIKLITKICYMYYYEEKVQSKIAKRFNITRQMVSKLIQKAKDEGILKIIIESPLKVVTELEIGLESKYNLKDVIVIQNDTISYEDLNQKLGKAAGEYFRKVAMSNLNIGVGFGSSLEAMAEHINMDVTGINFDEIKIVQLVGGINSNYSYDNSQYIMSLLGKKIDAQVIYLNAPYMVEEKEVRESIIKSSIYRKLLNLYDHLDYAFVQINPATRIYRTDTLDMKKRDINYLDVLGINYLNNVDAVGEVCLNYFNDRGHFVDTRIDDKIITIPHKKFRNIKKLVGIVGGEERHKAALGAVQSKMFDVLITDEDTAKYLLMNG